MIELKYKRFSKTLNCKILSTIPAVSTGIIFASLPATAMFRNALSSASRTVQSSSSISSNSLAKTSSTSTPRFFYGSNGRRIPIQTSTSPSSKSLLKPNSQTSGSSTQSTPLSSASSNSLTQALSTSTPRFFYGSNGRRIPIQTSTSPASKPLFKTNSPTTSNSTQSTPLSSASSNSGNRSIHEVNSGVQLIIKLRQNLEKLEDLSNRQQSIIRNLDEMKGLVNNALNNISQIIPNK